MRATTESLEDRALRAYEEVREREQDVKVRRTTEEVSFLLDTLRQRFGIEEDITVENRHGVIVARMDCLEFRTGRDSSDGWKRTIVSRWACPREGCKRAGMFGSAGTLALVGYQVAEYRRHVEFMHGGRS